jgi:hypothetical protein
MAARIIAACFLAALWGSVGWILMHQRRIQSTLAREGALPKPGPRANILLLWGIVLVGLSGLLLYYVFG